MLEKKRCLPCEGKAERLTSEAVETLHKQILQWDVLANDKGIARVFSFENFYETMAFVNAIAFMAHHENHHPDLEVHYQSCRVLYVTHALNGLSENDFICAAKVDALLGD